MKLFIYSRDVPTGKLKVLRDISSCSCFWLLFQVQLLNDFEHLNFNDYDVEL